MEGARKGQSKQTVNVRHISHSHNHAMTPEQEKHYSELFDQLDVDGDGRIDTKDLKEGLIRMGVPQVPGHAQVNPLLLDQVLITKLGLEV